MPITLVSNLSPRNTATTSCGLDQLTIGQSSRLIAVQGDAATRRRLLEMGFCNGVEIRLVRRAPLGDPIEFEVRGYHLSLRGREARQIIVTPAA